MINTILYSFVFIIFYIILSLINLIFPIIALIWIERLEDKDCECSEGWEKNYIRYYLYILFAFSILNTLFVIYLFSIFLKRSNKSKNGRIENLFILNDMKNELDTNMIYKFYQFFKFMLYIASIINCIISIYYIYNLKKNNCKCSNDKDNLRDVYYYWNIIVISIYIITITINLGYMIYKSTKKY